jgi:hypothetical protein
LRQAIILGGGANALKAVKMPGPGSSGFAGQALRENELLDAEQFAAGWPTIAPQQTRRVLKAARADSIDTNVAKQVTVPGSARSTSVFQVVAREPDDRKPQSLAAWVGALEAEPHRVNVGVQHEFAGPSLRRVLVVDPVPAVRRGE